MMSEHPILEVERHDDCAVLRPRGYLNGAAGERIDAACARLLVEGTAKIVINFIHTETINTMGVANLVSVLEKVGRDRGAVCFSNLPSVSRRMLDVLDISRVVLIFDDESSALAHLGALG